MGYMAFHARDSVGYVQRLERLAEQGFSVISAGMIENTAIHCLEWWAILEQKPAELAPGVQTDETAELLEAARKIARICKERVDCSGCPLANEATQCRISNDIGIHWTPESWPIIREV